MFPDLAPHGVARGTHAKVRIVWGHKYLSLRLNFAARMTSPLNCIMFSLPPKGKVVNYKERGLGPGVVTHSIARAGNSSMVKTFFM